MAAKEGIMALKGNKSATYDALVYSASIVLWHLGLYNSLKELLSNKSKLNQLGQKAKLRAENDFTWAAIGNKYLQLIKNLDN